MKSLSVILTCLVFVSCALPVQHHKVLVEKQQSALPLTRSEKYKECIIELSREGIKQSLIKELCDGTYGSLH